MKTLKAVCYAVWTIVGVVSLVGTAAYVWIFRDLFKSLKGISKFKME